jgi:hypothetical protein
VSPEGPELKETPGLYQEANNAIGFEYTPGWDGYNAGGRVHINSAGWRGKEFSPVKPKGIIRILTVGDSFTFGKAVDDEDVFAAQVEEMLNGDVGPRFEVINAGHENMNTTKELRYFEEREMIRLSPDVIVLGFTVHNDAEATSVRRQYRKLKRNAGPLLTITESDWVRTLSESSRIVRILRHGALWASDDELSDVYLRLIVSSYEEGSKSWENCRNALLGFHQVCRQNNIPFVLALLPVYTRKLDQTYREYPEEFKRIHEQISRVLSGKEGVTIVEMLDDLASSGHTIGEMRVPGDGHPNRIWHEIVARRLYHTIKDMGLKPK